MTMTRLAPYPGAKPSDFPRPELFRDPSTKPFRDADGTYHVFSYEHLMKVLVNKDQAFSRDPEPLVPENEIVHMALEFMWQTEPFTLDGEEGRHDVLRRVVEPWFKKRAVGQMEPIIRELTIEMIDEVVAKGTGEVDVAVELSSRLSMRVICRLTGMDVERELWMREKLDEHNESGWDSFEPQWDMEAYFWRVVAGRLAHPRDDLLDILVGAWRDGEISDVELLGYIFGFTAAGTDTTGATLANSLTLLDEFDLLDYARSVTGDPAALRLLVEEILRFGSPFPMKPVYVRKDSEFGDLHVPAGSILTIWIAAANRDEAVNGGVAQSDPMTFDPHRSPNRHLAVGWGKHRCLGAELASLETQILLEEALTRLPALRMDRARPFRRVAGIVDSVIEAHFVFDQEAAEAAATYRR